MKKSALTTFPHPQQAIHAQGDSPFPRDPNLLDDWLATKSEKTRRAYAGDLARFAEWLRAESPQAAAETLLKSGPRAARHIVVGYRSDLQRRELAPATINRALAALKSVVQLARDTGLIDWTLNIKGLKARSYRDTSGPDRAGVQAILAAADAQGDPRKAARDGALLRLLYGVGLRRSEAVGMDVRHLDLDSRTVWVKDKGMEDRTPLKLPGPVLAAMKRWMDVHSDPRPEAPLFVALDRRSGKATKRLSDRSVARVLKAVCKAAGVRAYAPHALRHAAVTHALDATSGDVRRVRAFSRHSKLETVGLYDDARSNGALAVAELIAL